MLTYVGIYIQEVLAILEDQATRPVLEVLHLLFRPLHPKIYTLSY